MQIFIFDNHEHLQALSVWASTLTSQSFETAADFQTTTSVYVQCRFTCYYVQFQLEKNVFPVIYCKLCCGSCTVYIDVYNKPCYVVIYMEVFS